MYPAARQVPDMGAGALREAESGTPPGPISPTAADQPTLFADVRPRAQPITALQVAAWDAIARGAAPLSPRPASLTRANRHWYSRQKMTMVSATGHGHPAPGAGA